MSLLLEHFRATMDAFVQGHIRAEFMVLGYPMTDGLLFPFPAGLLILRRRRLYSTVGEWVICGLARPVASTIRNLPGFPKQANMGFQYAAGVMLGNGYISEFCEPVRVDFDGAGNRISPPLPMFPQNLIAAPIAGGKFLVIWEYDPYGQGEPPTDFQVFAGADAGSVDYNTPLVDSVTGLNVVATQGNRRRYEFTTAAFTHGTVKVFAVRARSSAGVAEKNTFTSAAQIARTTTVTAGIAEPVGQRRQG